MAGRHGLDTSERSMKGQVQLGCTSNECTLLTQLGWIVLPEAARQLGGQSESKEWTGNYYGHIVPRVVSFLRRFLVLKVQGKEGGARRHYIGSFRRCPEMVWRVCQRNASSPEARGEK